MKIIKKPLGLYKANCYILIDEDKSIVIDPGFHGQQIIELLFEEKVTPLAILLTHAHCDHICGVDAVQEYFHIPVYMNPEDDELLHVKRRIPSAYKGLFKAEYEALHEGITQIGPFTIEVIKAPGHSKGSVLFKWDTHLFTGDVLFKGNIGNVETYNGSEEEMSRTLQMIKGLDPTLIIHPGHAEDTTLEVELQTNAALKK